MAAEDLQPVIDSLKAANMALAAKIASLEARATLTDQQLTDLKAAVDSLTTLGKP